MLTEGLLEEVKGLLAEGCKRSSVSMQGLGYKEIVAYLQGECTLEEAIYILKRDTRHFAKRQLTWFRRNGGISWIYRDDPESYGGKGGECPSEVAELTVNKALGIINARFGCKG
jgi:tRNA dimethylallyltransferase